MLKELGSHCVHAAEDAKGAKKPGRHAEQLPVAISAKRPSGHGEHAADEFASALTASFSARGTDPIGQSVHVVCSGVSVKDRLPHVTHAGSPGIENVPSAHSFGVALHEPAGHQKPAVQGPSHVAAERTVVARPYAPALHCFVHVDTLSPVAAPYVPHAQRFAVALHDPAGHQ